MTHALRQVPLLAVLENMAYFKDPRGDVHHPFGKTQLDAIRQYSQVPTEAAFRLPIEEEVTNACDDGVPVVLSRRARALAAAALLPPSLLAIPLLPPLPPLLRPPLLLPLLLLLLPPPPPGRTMTPLALLSDGERGADPGAPAGQRARPPA